MFTTPVDKLEGIIKGLESLQRARKIENLGEEPEIRKRYNEMAALLDKKLGR